MDKEKLRYEIANDRKLIEKHRAAQNLMRTQNSGVRSSNISSDLAAFDMAIEKAELRIWANEQALELLENES